MADTMTAVIIEGGKGPPESLKLGQIAKPTPQPGQILIKVKATGLNGADLMQRKGGYPAPPGEPDTMGLEAAGEVIIGAGRWKTGDRVCVLLGGGGYAEYAVCDARHALPIPEGMDFVQGAALPETLITVWANVFDACGLKAGETFMTNGATSGIGVAGIQMAKAAGAKVIATARGAAKAEMARSFGADLAIDTTAQPDFGKVAKEFGGVDVALDMVGGDHFRNEIEALKMGGRIVFIAASGGGEVTLPIWVIMRKRAIVTGSTLRPRTADEKARLVADVEKSVWPWVLAGKVKPVVDKVFPLAEAGAAHSYMEAGAHVGKVILAVD